MRERLFRGFTVLTAVVALGALAATAAWSSLSGGGTGSLHWKSGSKELIYFPIVLQNVYVANEYKAMKKEAAKYGYTVRAIDSNFDQAKADQNVQQYLATGQKPAAFLWQPVNAGASANDTRLLARSAPVVQLSIQPPTAGVSAYAGIDEVLEGQRMGDIGAAAQVQAKKIGMKLHSPNGNLVIFDVPKGASNGPERIKGFNAHTKARPMKVIGHEYGVSDPDTGYKVATAALPKYVGKGIDFLYVFNLQAAQGVVRAAEQAGLHPGKDVLVIAGDCSGSVDNIRTGKVFGTVIQPASVEGKLAVDTALQIIATGKVQPGTVKLPVAPVAPAVTVTSPHANNFEGLATMIGAKDLTKRYWGETYAKTCTG